ncbi:MAG: Gfo/Idh/MocA family oxidoreductase [Ruminococcaceae bacterium]|nr:Gfo/Idh/MocA family oxidoreductase [Oscillospiraceae bacterium]
MEKVRFGVIGLGGRGHGMMCGNLFRFKDIEITAVCDAYADRAERSADAVEEKYGKRPLCTTDYKELLHSGLVDMIYVATAWESHLEIAIEAMRSGVAVGIEVGGSYSIDECWELVKTHEQTGVPCMLMENCCYDSRELIITNMVRAGVFGTVVHCAGAYAHDLRDEIGGGNIIRHYRLRNYLNRNCENYPTHELGPIAKILNINRGNKFVSLVSVASKACGMEDYIKMSGLDEKDPTLKGAKFAQGDIVTTIITCANGETITLRLDTTLPREYNREFTVRGTRAGYDMITNNVYVSGPNGEHATCSCVDNYVDKYQPDVWYNITDEEREAGHGGMDGIILREFIDAYKEGRPMPIDVYDTAAWMCISCLSERSIAEGGAVQQIPDFTNGKWLIREPQDVLPMYVRDEKDFKCNK